MVYDWYKTFLGLLSELTHWVSRRILTFNGPCILLLLMLHTKCLLGSPCWNSLCPSTNMSKAWTVLGAIYSVVSSCSSPLNNFYLYPTWEGVDTMKKDILWNFNGNSCKRVKTSQGKTSIYRRERVRCTEHKVCRSKKAIFLFLSELYD